MSNWGQILVLGKCPRSLAQYLAKSRLDFETQPIETPITDQSKCLMAFLCGESYQERRVRSQTSQLSDLEIPTIVLGTDPNGELARECETHWHSNFIELPATECDLETAFNKALYEPNAKRHRIEMQDYATRLGLLNIRHRLILQLAADGVTNRRIARIVGLAEKSVERERQNARQLLKVKNSAEMMRVVTLGSIFEYSDLSSTSTSQLASPIVKP